MSFKENKPKVSIYVCYHDDFYMVKDGVFKPIQVGSSFSKTNLDMLKDNISDNISEKNDKYCEMTALYWAWKNDVDADWIGLMHYRRFFDFSSKKNKLDRFGCVPVSKMTSDSLEEFGINEKEVYKLLSKNPNVDGFLPKKWSTKNVGFKNIKEHYIKSKYHFDKDISLLRKVISDIFPNYVNAFDDVMLNDEGYFTNMFLFKKNVFNKYCNWVFLILEEFEKKSDITNYSKQSKRVYGYLGERLINVFLSAEENRDLKFVELDRVFFEDVTPKKNIAFPASPAAPCNDAVSIVIASDDNYVPYMATLIESIKASISNNRKIEFLIFDGGITQKNKFLLKKQIGSNFSVSFIDCSCLYKDISVHMHFSVSTFYRIAMGKILQNHKKVLYIDCDTIVLDDICNLWDIDLGGKTIAAAPDLIMKGFVNKGVPSLYETGGIPSSVYLKEYVGLSHEYDDYFQAGVILFDLEAYRRLNIADMAINELKNKVYWFLDQDVLNKFLVGNVKFIDTSWNFSNTIINSLLNFLDSNWRAKVIEDSLSPKIIHYAGFEAKPWNNPDADYGNVYWSFSRKTFWHDEVYSRLQRPISPTDIYMVKSKVYNYSAAAWHKMPLAVRRVLFRPACQIKKIL